MSSSFFSQFHLFGQNVQSRLSTLDHDLQQVLQREAQQAEQKRRQEKYGVDMDEDSNNDDSLHSEEFKTKRQQALTSLADRVHTLSTFLPELSLMSGLTTEGEVDPQLSMQRVVDNLQQSIHSLQSQMNELQQTTSMSMDRLAQRKDELSQKKEAFAKQKEQDVQEKEEEEMRQLKLKQEAAAEATAQEEERMRNQQEQEQQREAAEVQRQYEQQQQQQQEAELEAEQQAEQLNESHALSDSLHHQTDIQIDHMDTESDIDPVAAFASKNYPSNPVRFGDSHTVSSITSNSGTNQQNINTPVAMKTKVMRDSPATPPTPQIGQLSSLTLSLMSQNDAFWKSSRSILTDTQSPTLLARSQSQIPALYGTSTSHSASSTYTTTTIATTTPRAASSHLSPASVANGTTSHNSHSLGVGTNAAAFLGTLTPPTPDLACIKLARASVSSASSKKNQANLTASAKKMYIPPTTPSTNGRHSSKKVVSVTRHASTQMLQQTPHDPIKKLGFTPAKSAMKQTQTITHMTPAHNTSRSPHSRTPNTSTTPASSSAAAATTTTTVRAVVPMMRPGTTVGLAATLELQALALNHGISIDPEDALTQQQQHIATAQDKQFNSTSAMAQRTPTSATAAAATAALNDSLDASFLSTPVLQYNRALARTSEKKHTQTQSVVVKAAQHTKMTVSSSSVPSSTETAVTVSDPPPEEEEEEDAAAQIIKEETSLIDDSSDAPLHLDIDDEEITFNTASMQTPSAASRPKITSINTATSVAVVGAMDDEDVECNEISSSTRSSQVIHDALSDEPHELEQEVEEPEEVEVEEVAEEEEEAEKVEQEEDSENVNTSNQVPVVPVTSNKLHTLNMTVKSTQMNNITTPLRANTLHHTALMDTPQTPPSPVLFSSTALNLKIN